MTTPELSTRNPVWKVLVPVLVIIIAVVGALFLVKSQMQSRSQDRPAAARVDLSVGSTLPDFELQKFEGGTVHLSKIPAKVYLINFWATWCEACLAELPSLVNLHESFKDKGLQVLGINLDTDPGATVSRAIREQKITFPIFVDSESKIGDLFDLNAIPVTIIIDKNRKVLLFQGGERNWSGSDIQAQMEQWLSIRK